MFPVVPELVSTIVPVGVIVPAVYVHLDTAPVAVSVTVYPPSTYVPIVRERMFETVTSLPSVTVPEGADMSTL